MTTISSTLLISKLNEDILFYIFQLNTFTPDTGVAVYHPLQRMGASPRTLDTARWTSQVCHRWREILLRSPSIWGRVIDMRMASTAPGAQLWTEEVMKRTQNAPLLIHGVVEGKLDPWEFFSSLVVDRWHRMREVNVIILDDYVNHFIHDRVWDMFWTPAPLLERFIVNREYRHQLPTGDMLANRREHLFSSSAPLLRQVSCSGINQRTTWIRQLSKIVLSGPLTALEVLAIISRTPRLETLIIQQTPVPRAADLTIRVHLPNLSLLHIESLNLQDSLVYLDKIGIEPGCGLILRTFQDDGGNQTDNTTEQMSLFCRDIAPYAENYLKHHVPSEMTISIRGSPRYRPPQTPSIYVHIGPMTSSPEFSHTIFESIVNLHSAQWNTRSPLHPVLGALSSTHLHCITDLSFLNTTFSWLNSRDRRYINFISSLPSVRTLTATLSSINILCFTPTFDKSLVFPSLQHIKIVPEKTDIGHSSPKSLQEFLARRKAAHAPILTLDLSEDPFEYTQSMLDGFEEQGVTLRLEREHPRTSY